VNNNFKKELNRSGHDLTEAISRYFVGYTEEKNKNFQSAKTGVTVEL
jgi:hypothetical protein